MLFFYLVDGVIVVFFISHPAGMIVYPDLHRLHTHCIQIISHQNGTIKEQINTNVCFICRFVTSTRHKQVATGMDSFPCGLREVNTSL